MIFLSPYGVVNHGTKSHYRDGGIMSNRGTVVAFFSHSGENYKVGTIETGNGRIIASMISRMLGVPEYEICTEKGYPDDYEECSRIAKEERESSARPSLRFPLPDITDINSMILVYPNWWGDLPMAVYTMLDSIDTNGLKIYPVCTHEDNGLAMTDRMLMLAYPDASVMKGLAIRGTAVQERSDEVEESIRKYLEKVGFSLHS